jgi:hypothetical protein
LESALAGKSQKGRFNLKFEVMFGDFPRRLELDQANQSDPVTQEAFLLEFAQKPRKNQKIRQIFFGTFAPMASRPFSLPCAACEIPAGSHFI